MDTCRIEGCERPVHVVSRALCKTHYDLMRMSGEIPKRPLKAATCLVDECLREPLFKGYCEPHYRRWLKTGNPRRTSLSERFWKFVPDRPAGECWEWRGARWKSGYGNFRLNGSHLSAHRVAYELVVGPIPEGLTLDHLCMNKGCVNPAHLEPVTLRENILRGGNTAANYARRTECHICGGELTFYPNMGKYGVRVCLTCQQRRDAKKRGR